MAIDDKHILKCQNLQYQNLQCQLKSVLSLLPQNLKKT